MANKNYLIIGIILIALAIFILPKIGVLFSTTASEPLKLSHIEKIELFGNLPSGGCCNGAIIIKALDGTIMNWASTNSYDGRVSPAQAMKVRLQNTIPITAGSVFDITYDGGKIVRVYLPAFTGGTEELYIALDGSTYYDSALTNLAQASSGQCTPNCACAANTCPGSTCSDSCGGTCSGAKIIDNSCAANTCLGLTCTNNCGIIISGTATPSNSCAANTCIGATCSNGCGGTVSGTKICKSEVCSSGKVVFRICTRGTTAGGYGCSGQADTCTPRPTIAIDTNGDGILEQFTYAWPTCFIGCGYDGINRLLPFKTINGENIYAPQLGSSQGLILIDVAGQAVGMRTGGDCSTSTICTGCNTNADTNCDTHVDRTELGVIINNWIAGSATRSDLALAINAWMVG